MPHDQYQDLARVIVAVWTRRYKHRPNASKWFVPSKLNSLPPLLLSQSSTADKWMTEGSACVLTLKDNGVCRKPHGDGMRSNPESVLSIASTRNNQDSRPNTDMIQDNLNLIEQMLQATKESGEGFELLQELMKSMESYSRVMEQNIGASVSGEAEHSKASSMLERYVQVMDEVRQLLKAKDERMAAGGGAACAGMNDAFQSPIFKSAPREANQGVGIDALSLGEPAKCSKPASEVF